MRKICMADEDRAKVLCEALALDGISPNSLRILVDNSQVYGYTPGETIFLDNAACLGISVVLAGYVKLFKASPHGRELVVRVLGKGSLFNEVAALDGGNNPVNAAALSPVEIMDVHPAALKQCLELEPNLSQRLIMELCQNQRSLMGLVEELSFYQITNRLARLIARLPEARLNGNTKQRITQEELANYLGTVREVVARSLRELEKSGAIQVSRTGICIADRQILTVWAKTKEN